jgi:hypothetical protein
MRQPADNEEIKAEPAQQHRAAKSDSRQVPIASRLHIAGSCPDHEIQRVKRLNRLTGRSADLIEQQIE